MNENTLLTCTEFVAQAKGNHSLLRAFRAEFRKKHRELANVHTLKEWEQMYEQYKSA